MLLIARLLTIATGAGAILVGTSILVLGLPVVDFTTGLYNTVAGTSGGVALPRDPTWDNELRFYAALFTFWGAMCTWTGRTLPESARVVLGLQFVFFVGGLGRVASWLAVGAPHPAFVLLMGYELIVPILIAGCLRVSRTDKSASD